MRPDPTELDLHDPHAKQVLAKLHAPFAKAIGRRITRLKFDYRLGKHFDLLSPVSLLKGVNHRLRAKYSNLITLRRDLC
jgi:hypothetical protein